MKKLLPAVLLLVLVLLLCTSASSEAVLQLPAGTKTISSQTFFRNSSLNIVILPEGLETIESMAFAFSSVRMVYLPESVKSIASDAFASCTVIGYGKKSGTYAANFFNSHSGLKYVQETPANLFTYEDTESSTCLITGYTGSIADILLPRTAPDGKKVIGLDHQAFIDNTVIQTAVVPEGYTHIHHNAFYGCKNLMHVDFPSTLRYFGYAVFYGCDNLYSVDLPDGITEADEWNAKTIPFASIGSSTAKALGKALSCFRVHGCDADLRYMYTGDEVTDLALVRADEDVVNFTVPEGVTCIGYKSEPNSQGFRGCADLETVQLPDSLVRIDREGFFKCSKLKYVALPQSVRYIGQSAFNQCSLLSSAVLSVNLETIDKYAFWGCQNLKNVTITAGVTSIQEAAFRYSGVETFWIVAENLTDICSDSLQSTGLTTIYCYPDTATWTKLESMTEYADFLKANNSVG